MVGRNRTTPSAGRLFERVYLAEATQLAKATLFGHRVTLFWPPPVRLFAQPTHAREASRQHPAGDVDAYAHTHAGADELWGPQYVPLSLIRNRSMYMSYVPRSRGHFGGRSMYISYRTGRRRAVAGNGGAVAGNGRAVGAPCAVAGSADSAHQHRLIQQEAVAIFGLVVLWCRGAFWFLGLQRCCCDSAPGRGGVCFRVVCDR